MEKRAFQNLSLINKLVLSLCKLAQPVMTGSIRTIRLRFSWELDQTARLYDKKYRYKKLPIKNFITLRTTRIDHSESAAGYKTYNLDLTLKYRLVSHKSQKGDDRDRLPASVFDV